MNSPPFPLSARKEGDGLNPLFFRVFPLFSKLERGIKNGAECHDLLVVKKSYL